MNNLFTPEQQEELRKNPNVVTVTERSIRFSAEFKEKAYLAYLEGTPMRDIFRENGIDPEVLGDTRIYSFTSNLKDRAVRDQPFTDLRAGNRRRINPADDPTGQIERLTHQVAYLTQQVEFLKKNLAADMAARELWESRHLHMKNLKSSKKPSKETTTS